MDEKGESLKADVRVKKTDGTLQVSSEGLQWSPFLVAISSRQPFTLAWSSIKEQQVSSMKSPKAMIKLSVFNMKASVVLEFIHPEGLEKAFEVRNQVKTFIMQQLARTNRPASVSHTKGSANELKHRAAVLASQPLLKKQHTEMVQSGLVSEEDFWATRRDVIAAEAGKRQRSSKTSEILTDLASQSAPGGSVVKYQLNAEIIHQIFVQYPAVHRAYKEQVPDRMSETDFWGTFFKSKYFHRDRAKAGHEDLFTKYEEAEIQEAQQAKNGQEARDFADPLVDLTMTEEDKMVHEPLHKNKRKLFDNSLSKFNRHAAYVLDPSHSPVVEVEATKRRTRREPRDSITESVRLPDLEPEADSPYIKLELEDERRYFQSNQQDDRPTDAMDIDLSTQGEISAFELHLPRAYTDTQSSIDVINRLEMLVASESIEQTATGPQQVSIPEDFKSKIYGHFNTVSELLRHFYSLYSKTKNPAEDAKLGRILKKMEEKYANLQQIRQSLPHDQRSTLGPLLKPFDDQLNHAFVKYEQRQR